MVAALPTHTLELYVSGAWTAVQANLIGTVHLDQHLVRTETEAIPPATLSFTLANPSGIYTPDNPTSLWGTTGMPIGTPVRWKVTWSATTRCLFLGRVDTVTPQFGKSSKDGTVAFSATDLLGQAGRKVMRSDICERWNYAARSGTSTADVWMFGEGDGVTEFANVGYNAAGGAARIVPSQGGRGEATRDDADGLTVEGAVTLTDNDGYGPVLIAEHAIGQQFMMFWFRFDDPPPYSPDYDVLMQSYTVDGFKLWEIRWYDTGSSVYALEVYDGGGVSYGVLDATAHDGAWHPLYIWNTGAGNTGFYYDHSAVILSGTGIGDLADQATIVLGGDLSKTIGTDVTLTTEGKQRRCMTVTLAALMVTPASVAGLEPFAQPGQVDTADTRFDDLANWADYTATFAMVGTDTRDVAIKSTLGRTHLDCLSELALTLGGTLWHDPEADQVELLTGPTWRPQTLTATLTLEQDDDLDAGHEWGLSRVDSATRATATCPAGEGTYIDTTLEGNGIQDADTLETAAATVDDARSLAAWQVGRIRRLSLSQIGVDLTSAVNAATLWPLFLALQPGTRIRVASLDQTVMGITYIEVHALGWTVEFGPTGERRKAQWTLQCLPADSPAEWTVEDTTYGRIGWESDEATGSSLTSSGTSLTITSTGPPLTTTGAYYPMTLRLGTEDVTVAAAPASSVSPQTVTIARAANGTLAVAHSAGHTVLLAPDVRIGP